MFFQFLPLCPIMPIQLGPWTSTPHPTQRVDSKTPHIFLFPNRWMLCFGIQALLQNQRIDISLMAGLLWEFPHL